jgi:hypothetical protein
MVRSGVPKGDAIRASSHSLPPVDCTLSKGTFTVLFSCHDDGLRFSRIRYIIIKQKKSTPAPVDPADIFSLYHGGKFSEPGLRVDVI